MIWLENLRDLILTLQVHFNLVVYLLLDSSASASDVSVKQIFLKFSSQILSPFLEQLSLAPASEVAGGHTLPF
jgi:hypothetical protein